MTLIGTWELTSFVTTYEDGSTEQSYGDNPQGRIVYTADGFMSAHVWDADRHRPVKSGGGDPPYFSYCGTWKLRENDVCHHVITSSHFNWGGTTVVRRVLHKGDEVELIADEEFNGRKGVSVIRWHRFEPSAQ